MTKKAKIIDERYMGTEPSYNGNVLTSIELINAYNWYNYFQAEDDAKKYFLAYIKSQKFSAKDIKKLSQVNALEFRKHSLGWNSRIMSMGGVLSADIKERFDTIVRELLESCTFDIESDVKKSDSVPVSVIDRIREKASNLIANIEGAIDDDNLNPKEFFIQNDIKAPIAKIILNHFKPQYAEVWDAFNAKDDQLIESYASWSKKDFKKHLELIREIVSQAENKIAIADKIRKPRKAKQKTPSMLVKKLKFKNKDDEYGYTSIKPEDIIGSDQLWIFNTKKKTLSVYNAMAASGLSIKGSKIIGYDENTSITKKLRKPKEQLEKLMNGGKVILKKFMSDIKTKEQKNSGRINTDSLILRRQK